MNLVRNKVELEQIEVENELIKEDQILERKRQMLLKIQNEYLELGTEYNELYEQIQEYKQKIEEEKKMSQDIEEKLSMLSNCHPNNLSERITSEYSNRRKSTNKINKSNNTSTLRYQSETQHDTETNKPYDTESNKYSHYSKRSVYLSRLTEMENDESETLTEKRSHLKSDSIYNDTSNKNCKK